MSRNMRSPEEMMALIVETAMHDERVRAVVLNGSRVNPSAASDSFQDFDVVFIVADFQTFLADPSWIDCFGERMILQLPDTMVDPPPTSYDRYCYLMQFMDGNRIDLTLFPIERLAELELESLSLLLIDKDDILDPLPPPSEDDYLPSAPSKNAYSNCCNEFWWVCPYVAKGLWRGEIIYAKATFNIVHEQLVKMLVWHVGIKTQFHVNLGSHNKRLQKYLEPELWRMFLATYSDSDPENSWDALFTMIELFRRAAREVASHFSYAYPAEEDERVTEHLRHARALPKDAKSMY